MHILSTSVYTDCMATKKTSVRKKPAKAALKKTVPKKTSVKNTRHLRLTRETEPFFTFRVSRETLHWLILSVVVISFVLWVTKLEGEIVDAYDKIDANQATIDSNTESIQRNRAKINNLLRTTTPSTAAPATTN